VECGARTSFPKTQGRPVGRRARPGRAPAHMPAGDAAGAGNDRFCSCVSWSSEGLWILSFGSRNSAQCPVRCVHGLEPSDRPAYCRNAPVLRLWSNRLGRPNAEIAQLVHSTRLRLLPLSPYALRRQPFQALVLPEEHRQLRLASARSALDRSERGAAGQTRIAKRNPCLLRSRFGRGKLVERCLGRCPLGSDMKLPVSTCTRFAKIW
jgi:hypothetical protein